MSRIVRALATVALTLLAPASSPALAAEFCWLDTHPRGVGTVPADCPPGRERIGLLCYARCPEHMTRFGFDCHSVCPPGLRDDGLFCRAAEYGRGVGYPWKFGDGLNDHGMRARCEAAHGAGGCEKSGLIFYPRCRPGFHAFGCCICRPTVPDCNALGLRRGIDLSCAKRIQIGDPRPGVCAADQDYDAGLCYRRCPPGYTGVGPVCWGKVPQGWVHCGMGAAKDKTTCGTTVFGQVASVGNLALTVATLGLSTPATGAAKGAESVEEVSRLRKVYETLKAAYQQAKPVLALKKPIGVGLTVEDIKESEVVTAEDIARVSAQIAAIADPTGVSDSIASYTYPKCSKYFDTSK